MKNRLDSNKKFPETDIIKMLDFLIDNIHVFAAFKRSVFRQEIIGISLGTYLLDCSFIHTKLT